MSRPVIKTFTGIQIPFVGYTYNGSGAPPLVKQRSSHLEEPSTFRRASSTAQFSAIRLEKRIAVLEAELAAANAVNSGAGDPVCLRQLDCD